MAWARVQSKSGSTSSGQTVTVTVTTTPVTGNKIIVSVANVSSVVPTPTCKDGASTALTQAAISSNATGLESTVVLFYDVPATPQSAFTVTGHGTSDQISVVVQEISGLLAGNTTACLDSTWGTKTGSTTATGSPTYTSTAANEYLLTVFGDFGSGATATQPAGYTLDANPINASTFADCCPAYKNSANGSEASSWTYTPTTGDQWALITGAFKLSGGGSPVLNPVTPKMPYVQAVRRAALY